MTPKSLDPNIYDTNNDNSTSGWTTFIKKHWAERQLKIKQNQHAFRELSDFNYFKSESVKIAEHDQNSDSQLVNIK